MVILQQYYTSWHNQKIQKTGFQVKAQSPGITPEIADTLTKLIGYSIPSQSDTSTFATHPIAFRYYVDNNLAILISSQSSGKDELGRSGNFFAHSIVGTPDEIAYPLAPIFYWKSPFWINQDESDETILPLIEHFHAEVVFDFDSVWSFIYESNRREWFYQMICAVVDNHQSQRRIIIVDEAESVALWIAAISTVLPPIYCHFLSFSTYHHDPGRVPFIITGTTADSNFRCTSDTYVSYFILNAYEGCVSKAPRSDYADYISARLNQEQYEDEVLDFFNWVERLDSQPQVIDRQLDNYINFYQAVNSQEVELEPIKLVVAIRSIINVISQKVTIGLEDIADIRAACRTLGNTLLRRQDKELIEEYQRSLELLKKYDGNFEETFEVVFDILSLVVLQKRREEANIFSALIAEFYPESLRNSAINQPNNIQKYANHLRDNDLAQVVIFWEFLGKDLQLTQETERFLQPIFSKTFRALQHQASANGLQVPDLAAKVIANISAADSIDDRALFRIACEYNPVLEWLYYAKVEKVSLVERSQHYWRYWENFQQEAPNLSRYELQRDLINSTTYLQIIQTLRDWVNNVHIDSRSKTLNEAINFILSKQFENLSTVDTPTIILHLLSEESLLKHLDQRIYYQFVQSILAQAKICKLDSLTLKLYQKLLLELLPEQTYSYSQSIDGLKIDWQKQSIIRGAIDLTKGILQAKTVPELCKYFNSITREQYKQDASKLCKEFFVSEIDPDAHFKLICGVYSKTHREEFWEIYWSSFHSYLLEKERINDIVRIMDLWFNASADLVNHPYAVPEFFTELPSLLEEIQSSKNYRRIEREFQSQLAAKDWYPVIEKYFQKSRKRFLGNFF
ncbi:hypothetical protein G7B40_010135 [Aetokthonos hydrillicola Thurmond2011]|jgi:hypothetical protein|uniref:Uncharacterized protein n=1 Tax=Aetokthonos hydrillicola Thurmond2011 TaxID=2712845 RepID=A0AAP5I4K5_9CYAN|nr:hypothetical protein [Aetokthonos hydrillicola]MBO3459013.1 hypothetical protein [Aetokthonos hydrillicola CCALA 1050]MBW4589121.1 hypothetical protein [Aetokthonos hydrillicola CCALA 1050]MDR9894923.1 hypothetical protein [Aetokthonos hydrillicola Thurmond2011]